MSALTSRTELPTLFLVAAEHALVSGGDDPSVPEWLEEATAFAAPVLTLKNLMARRHSLLDAAEQFAAKARPGVDRSTLEGLRERLSEIVQRGTITSSDVNTVFYDAADDGLMVGLVAGYMLARMLDGQGGAR